MGALDRFSDRYHYETRFMEEGLPLWMWESGTTSRGKVYEFNQNGEIVEKSTKPYSNTEFRPSEWFTDESSPDYFKVDLYAISVGGSVAYYHTWHWQWWEFVVYDDYYASGGSGGVVYLQNVKIRLRDENQKGIVYTAYGYASPINKTYSSSIDSAGLFTGNTNDDIETFCVRLAENYQTPKGVAPAGMIVFAIPKGGNARRSGGNVSIGRGATNIYIPEQCAFETSLDDVPTYTPGTQYTTGMWMRYESQVYRAPSNFTATNWANDSRIVTPAGNYDANTTYQPGYYLWYKGTLYNVKKQFKGDENNTILGFADYFLKKDEITYDYRANGRDGTKVHNGSRNVNPTRPPRFFTQNDINASNVFWLNKTLGWGSGQGGTGRLKTYGGEQGGIVLLYKGEAS